MKITIILLVCAFSYFQPFIGAEKEVYICNGKASSKYHLTMDCRGLEYCSTEVQKITLKEAKDKGRTLCGWED